MRSRQTLIVLGLGVFGASASACSAADGSSADDDAALDGSHDASFDGSSDGSANDAKIDDDTSGDGTASDAITTDAGKDAATDADAGYPFPTPIRYVVVIVKENHTFDNMFTGFPGTDPPPASVKLADGTTVTRKPAAFKPLLFDTTHAHTAGVSEYNDGKMNGWSTPLAAGLTAQALSYFPESQIPNYWAYARNFVLFDHFFSTFMGPSGPGHFSTHTANTVSYENVTGSGDCSDLKAAGNVGTFDPKTGATKDMFPCFDVPAVESLLPKTLTWRAYPGSPLDYVQDIGGDPAIRAAHYHSMGSLLDDVGKGELANLTYANVGGVTYDGAPASEHPPQHPCNGENYTVELVNRLMKSKYWPEMAIIFTYDDYGGWYDHVKPTVELCTNGDFFHTGFRLPAMIISPYAKTGFVDHTKTEHASIPRLIEDLFGLPRMTANPKAPWNKYVPRDATAGSMMGAFDFTQPPRPAFIRTKRTDCPAAPP